MFITKALEGSLRLRNLQPDDAVGLAKAYQKNRTHLAPWEPIRAEAYYSESGQDADIRRVMDECSAGRCLALVLVDGPRIIGRATLSGIVHGAFRSADLGYWIDAEYQGRGLATATVQWVAEYSTKVLALHRLQAGTLLHNFGSQNVLEKSGFSVIGTAPEYLCIAGQWQDHKLYQRILCGN